MELLEDLEHLLRLASLMILTAESSKKLMRYILFEAIVSALLTFSGLRDKLERNNKNGKEIQTKRLGSGQARFLIKKIETSTELLTFIFFRTSWNRVSALLGTWYAAAVAFSV